MAEPFSQIVYRLSSREEGLLPTNFSICPLSVGVFRVWGGLRIGALWP